MSDSLNYFRKATVRFILEEIVEDKQMEAFSFMQEEYDRVTQKFGSGKLHFKTGNYDSFMNMKDKRVYKTVKEKYDVYTKGYVSDAQDWIKNGD